MYVFILPAHIQSYLMDRDLAILEMFVYGFAVQTQAVKKSMETLLASASNVILFE